MPIDMRGAEKFLEGNKRFRGQLGRTVSRSLKRSLGRTSGRIRKDLRGLGIVQGITRSTWGKSQANRLTARVKAINLRLSSEREIEAAVGLYGYPAVLETGGRLVPHEIFVRGRAIKHPGATVGGYGLGRSNLRRDETVILGQLDRDVSDLVSRVYGL